MLIDDTEATTQYDSITVAKSSVYNIEKLNQDIAEFIKNMQTPFSKYTPEFRKHLIDVVVEVDDKKARFFKAIWLYLSNFSTFS